MTIYTCRQPLSLTQPFVEINEGNPGVPLHPADLAAKAESWIMEGRSFATCHEVPIITAQRLVRQKRIPCGQVNFCHQDKDGRLWHVHLDADGEMIQPWPE